MVEVILNKCCLKVEKENAQAMINGFYKDADRIRTIIFTAHKDAKSLDGNFVFSSTRNESQ